MVKTEIVGGGTGEVAKVIHSPMGGTLIATDPCKLCGTFKATTFSAAGTTQLVTPTGGGSIVLTDIIITTEKKASGTLTVTLTDGTNSIDIIGIQTNDAPCNLAIPIAGRFPGWKNARVDVTTVEDYEATVTVGYVKIPAHESLSYAKWNALR